MPSSARAEMSNTAFLPAICSRMPWPTSKTTAAPVVPERMRMNCPDSSSLTSAVAPVGAFTAEASSGENTVIQLRSSCVLPGSPGCSGCSSAGSKSSSSTISRRGGRDLRRGRQLQQAEVIGPPAADRRGAEQRHDNEHRRQRTPAFSRPPVVPVGRDRSRQPACRPVRARAPGRRARSTSGARCRRLRIARRAPPMAPPPRWPSAQPRALPRQALQPGLVRIERDRRHFAGVDRQAPEQPADIRIRCW